MLKRLSLNLTLWLLWIMRKIISADSRAYMLLSVKPLQPLLVRIGLMRARAAYLKAARLCPAYKNFLEENNYVEDAAWELSGLPVMTKENYVKRYSIEARCYGGEIPATGVVIDESSGSSGVPNNWVRSAEERADVKHILQLNYKLIYRDRGCLLLNCFALGPWATGMNVSMSLVDAGILKSIGPEQAKLENTLEVFGSKYRYLIFGYPPFIKTFVDTTRLNLSDYHLDLVVGGEGISEGLRAYLLQHFNSVISSYGASDLEINIGVETELTIHLRRLCAENTALARKLFGRDGMPPMIFQYNPLDYIIEQNADGELLFTIGRQDSAAPKIRYNLRDRGGTLSHRQLTTRLIEEGIDVSTLAARQSYFPLLYVYGRNDLTVLFYGAKVYPSDIEEIISADPRLVKNINSFQLSSYEDAQINRRLKLHLELVKDTRADALPDAATLRDVFFDELRRVNQNFREVTKMFGRESLEMEVHLFETGPFQGRDIRIKNRYVDTTT